MDMNENQIIISQFKLLNGRQLFDLEITTRCNKQCYICPRDNFQRKNKDMSFVTFEKIVEWLPTDCDVFFAGYGEPLLHKDYLLFVQQLHTKGVGVSLLTNGKLLTAKKIQELFDVGLDRLQISILLKNELNEIEKYVKMTNSNQSSKIRFNLMYDYSVTKPFAITEELQSKGFEVCYKLIHNRANELYDACHFNEIITCGTFFVDTYIDTNGSLQICSNDINGKYNLGSIYEMSFDELRNRKKEFAGNKTIIPICEHCTDEYRLKHFQI
jgi:organic radical activating enzyme